MFDSTLIKEYFLWDFDKEHVYISKDMDKLLNIETDDMQLYGVIDTRFGLKLAELNKYDDDEYHIGKTFMHRDTFIGYCREVYYI